VLVDDVPIWTMPAYNREDGPNVRADGSPLGLEGCADIDS